jgi:NAD(P)-dependent dehydrogenase (short-subunit alcohol dehydrogenase family)
MSNPVVLITGGLTGIGRAAAFAFAHNGARVVVSGRRNAEGEALANDAPPAQKPSSSAPMFAMRTMSVT